MRFIRHGFFLFIGLLFFPYSLSAWGDGKSIGERGCKFEKESGYSNASVYLKGKEAFIIVDVTDTRYGTTSIVYNALTCEKVTSGNKADSDFSGLMAQKDFRRLDIIGKYNNIDSQFTTKVEFSEDSNSFLVHIEPIGSDVTQELKSLFASISDKSASSQINISDATKELLGYSSFYKQFFDKLSSLPKSEINYDFTLALISKLEKINVNIDSSKEALLVKQGELREEIARIEKEANDKFFESSVKSINDVPQWISKMNQLGKQELINDYIPKIIRLSDFGKNLTINNFLSSIEYKYILINMKPYVSQYQYGSEYGLELRYKNKKITLKENGVCHSTGNITTSEFSCGFLWANTCVGTYKHYKCRADTSMIAKIERELTTTTKVANSLSQGWKYRDIISRYTKVNNYANTSSRNYASPSSSSSSSSSSSPSSSSSSSNNKPKGVKKIYAHGKGSRGQTLHAIICYNGRTRYENWQRNDGLWMSGSTTAGHRNQSLDEYAKDFCR